jgi:uncharacterized protein YyaL (SSP411 family)
MEFQLSTVKEIVIVGERGSELERAVYGAYLPCAVVAIAEDPSDELPLLKDRSMIDGSPTAYVCENFVCQRPVTEVEELTRLLSDGSPD